MKLCIFVSVLLTVSSGVLSQFFEGKSLFPIDSSYHHGGIASQYLPLDTTQKDQCELYKVGFKQDLYFQYIQYKVGIPELKEFTLCMWNKFSNHSNDHPIFSYAGICFYCFYCFKYLTPSLMAILVFYSHTSI